MIKLLYVEINAFALFILAIICFNIRRNTSKYQFEQKLFLLLIYTDALVLLMDTLMWLADGVNGMMLTSAYRVITACYYMLNPLICLIWAYYVDHLIYHSGSHLKKTAFWLAIPAAVNIVLSSLSIFTGWMFSIDAANIYHRGPLFPLMAAIAYFYLVYAFAIILIRRNRIPKQYFLPVLFFAVPPFIGGLLQVLFYGLSLIWVCTTISIFIVFINIQTDQQYTDFLTGLYNRRQLDNYVRRLRSSKRKFLIGGMMIDLAQFKKVNDGFGHDEGDRALQYVANILRETFRNRDFIVRLGGDEFLVLMEIAQRADLENVSQRLGENVKKFNESGIVPYKITMNFGYDCYDSGTERNIENFISCLDDLMYQDKRSRQT